MGIYEEKKFDFNVGFGQAKKYAKPIALIVVALIVLYLIYLMAVSYQANALNAHLNKNPLSLASDADAILTVNLTNVTEADALNVKVNVYPKDVASLHVYPSTKTVSLLGKGESRKLEFVVKPVFNGEVLPGDYKINVETEINGQKFSSELVLTLVE
jgi:hypothetical protein